MKKESGVNHKISMISIVKKSELTPAQAAMEKTGTVYQPSNEQTDFTNPFFVKQAPDGNDVFAPDQLYDITIAVLRGAGITFDGQNLYDYIKTIPFEVFRSAFLPKVTDTSEQTLLKVRSLNQLLTVTDFSIAGNLPEFMLIDRAIKEMYLKLRNVSRKHMGRIFKSQTFPFRVKIHCDHFKDMDNYNKTNLSNDILLERYKPELEKLFGEFAIIFVDAIEKDESDIELKDINIDDLVRDLYASGYIFKGCYSGRNTLILIKPKDREAFTQKIEKIYFEYLNLVVQDYLSKNPGLTPDQARQMFDIRSQMIQILDNETVVRITGRTDKYKVANNGMVDQQQFGKFYSTVFRLLEEELKYNSGLQIRNGELTGSPKAYNLGAAKAYKRYVMGSLQNTGFFDSNELEKLQSTPMFKVGNSDDVKLENKLFISDKTDIMSVIRKLRSYKNTQEMHAVLVYGKLNDLQKQLLYEAVHNNPFIILTFNKPEEHNEALNYINEYQYNGKPLISNSKEDPIYYENGEVYQKTVIVDASKLTPEQKQMFFNEFGVFRFDGASFSILGHYDKVMRSFFGIANQGQLKTYGYQDGMYLKHAEHLIPADGMLGKLLTQNNIARLTFIENEKNDVAIRDGLLTDLNDLMQNKKENFKIIHWKSSNIHRIKEGDAYKDEIKGNAQAAHATAMTEYNRAITQPVIDFHYRLALENANLLNKFSQEDIDKHIKRIAIRVIEKPTNLTENIFSTIFYDLDKAKYTEKEIADLLRELSSFPVVKDVLKHYMNQPLKDRVKYTMEGFAPVLTPDLGNLSEARIKHLKMNIEMLADKELAKETAAKPLERDEFNQRKKELAEKLWKEYYDENGFLKYNNKKMGVVLSESNARSLKIFIGDSVSTFFIPLDSVMGINGLKVVGVLPDSLMPRNSMIMNSEYTQLIGRDFDIDVMYVNVKPKWLSEEEWNNITDEMAKIWKNYVSITYAAMKSENVFPVSDNPLEIVPFAQKVKLAFDAEAKYQFMANYLGATEQQREARKDKTPLMSVNTLNISTKFFKDIKFLILYREARQLFTQGQAFAPEYGIDYRKETMSKDQTRLWWEKADLALNIATNNNVDYPKDNSKDYYNSDPINILIKTLMNTSKELAKAKALAATINSMNKNKKFPVGKIFSIVRYRKGYNEFSKATTALHRIQDAKEMIEDPNEAYGIIWNKEEFMKHPLIAFIDKVDVQKLEEHITRFMVTLNSNREVAFNAYVEYQAAKNFMQNEFGFPIEALETLVKFYLSKYGLKVNISQQEFLEAKLAFKKFNKDRGGQTRYREYEDTVKTVVSEKATDYNNYISSLFEDINMSDEGRKIVKSLGLTKGQMLFPQDVYFAAIRELMFSFDGFVQDEELYNKVGLKEDAFKINEMENSIYSLYKLSTSVSRLSKPLQRMLIHYFINQLSPSVSSPGIVLRSDTHILEVEPGKNRWIYRTADGKSAPVYIRFGSFKNGSEVEKFILDKNSKFPGDHKEFLRIFNYSEQGINIDKKNKIAIDYLNSMKSELKNPDKAIRYLFIRFLGMNIQGLTDIKVNLTEENYEYLNAETDKKRTYNRNLTYRNAWYNQPLLAIASAVQPSFVREYMNYVKNIKLDEINGRIETIGEFNSSYNVKLHVPSFLLKLLILFTVLSSVLSAQQLGFGCLGFVGGFAGYEIQGYKPTGLNSYIGSLNTLRSDSLISPGGDFSRLSGYRFGINIIRNRVSGFEYTVKGFYSALTETRDLHIRSVLGQKTEEFEVKLNSFGVGIELGSTITKFLSIKIINAEVSYNTAILFRRIMVNDNQLIREKNTSSAGGIGWNVGGGFIIYLLERQISIEGQAGLSNLKIDRLEKPDGSPFPKDEQSNEPMTDFISGGGFTALIQLNISFPL